MLKNLKKLNRTNLRGIHGGIDKCDIGPIDCPCKIPVGDPCLGGPGGTPGGPEYGYCPISSRISYVQKPALTERVLCALSHNEIKKTGLKPVFLIKYYYHFLSMVNPFLLK